MTCENGVFGGFSVFLGFWGFWCFLVFFGVFGVFCCGENFFLLVSEFFLSCEIFFVV